MNLVSNIMTSNICYKANQKIYPTNMVLYCQKSDLDIRDTVMYFKMHGELDYGVHAVVSDDENMYQLIPWNRRCWSSDDNNINTNSISVLVLYSDNVSAIIDNLVFLLNDVEFIRKNITSVSFGDVDTMGLLNDIAPNGDFIALLKSKIYNSNELVSNVVEDEPVLVISSGFASYKRQITKKNIRIKTRPTGSSATVGYLPLGVVTIIDEEKDDNGKVWGLLESYRKNRNGWVKLELL